MTMNPNDSPPQLTRICGEFRLPQSFRLRDGRSCLIRSKCESDAEEFCRILPQMHEETDFLLFMPDEFKLTVEEEREYLRKTLQPNALSIAAVVEGRIVGSASARPSEHRRTAHHAELGVAVLKEFWGLGLGRKLTEVVVDWGRAAGLRKMYLNVYEDNHRAYALYRKLGFVEEARLGQHLLRVDGTYSDTIIMSVDYTRIVK